MRMRFLLAFLLFAFVPFPVNAQGGLTLDSLKVSLWPEYDQPSMLVIYDFQVSEETSLPARVVFAIPAEANLIAVAYAPSGNLLNVPYPEPVEQDGWQVVAVTVDTDTIYHLEYYAPLTQADSQREYLFLWPGDYAVGTFNVSVKVPVDTTEYATDPEMRATTPADNGQTTLEWGTSNLEAGEQLRRHAARRGVAARAQQHAQHLVARHDGCPGETPGGGGEHRGVAPDHHHPLPRRLGRSVGESPPHRVATCLRHAPSRRRRRRAPRRGAGVQWW